MKQRSILIARPSSSPSAPSALRGQDPDDGAGRGRPLSAYRPSVPGVHGLVTAGHPLAAMAGLHVLMKGGNAFDAAMAVGATLNMMEPQMNGIGGNGFMTLYDKKSGKVLLAGDGRRVAESAEGRGDDARDAQHAASTPASCRATSAAT